MIKNHIIEVVCTGNSGRSTQAEVIGNHMTRKYNLEDVLLFISSGTNAGPENDNDLPYNKVVSVLGYASKHGLMKPVYIDEQKYNSNLIYRLVTKERVRMAFKIMRPIEAALRDAALFDMGLQYNGTRTQTVPRDDVSLVLGMTQKHEDEIKIIYSQSNQIPLISTITKYAGVPGEIPNGLGNPDLNVYIQIRDKLYEIMPKVIERFKNDFLQ